MIKLTWKDSAVRLSEMMEPAADTNWGRVTSIVPPGYNRYLRIFNAASHNDADATPIKWSEVAAKFGKSLAADMQWNRDMSPGGEATLGFGEPWVGAPDATLLQALGEILLRHEPEVGDWNLSTSWIYGDVPSAPEGSVVTFPTGYEMLTYKGNVRDEAGGFLLPYLNAGRDTPGRLPMYLWPESMEWVIGQALYGRSSYLACSHEVAAEVLADPRLDAIEVNSWDVAEHED